MELRLKPRKLFDLNGSLAVILPPEWIHHHNLRARQMMNLTVTDSGDLNLQPTPEVKDGR